MKVINLENVKPGYIIAVYFWNRRIDFLQKGSSVDFKYLKRVCQYDTFYIDSKSVAIRYDRNTYIASWVLAENEFNERSIFVLNRSEALKLMAEFL